MQPQEVRRRSGGQPQRHGHRGGERPGRQRRLYRTDGETAGRVLDADTAVATVAADEAAVTAEGQQLAAHADSAHRHQLDGAAGF